MTNTVILDNKTYFIVPIEVEYINLHIVDGKFKNLLIFTIHRDLYKIIKMNDVILFDIKNKQYHLFDGYHTKEEPIGYSDIFNKYVTVTDFVSNNYEDVTPRIKSYNRKQKIKIILQ